MIANLVTGNIPNPNGSAGQPNLLCLNLKPETYGDSLMLRELIDQLTPDEKSVYKDFNLPEWNHGSGGILIVLGTRKKWIE